MDNYGAHYLFAVGLANENAEKIQVMRDRLVECARLNGKAVEADMAYDEHDLDYYEDLCDRAGLPRP